MNIDSTVQACFPLPVGKQWRNNRPPDEERGDAVQEPVSPGLAQLPVRLVPAQQDQFMLDLPPGDSASAPMPSSASSSQAVAPPPASGSQGGQAMLSAATLQLMQAAEQNCGRVKSKGAARSSDNLQPETPGSRISSRRPSTSSKRSVASVNSLAKRVNQLSSFDAEQVDETAHTKHLRRPASIVDVISINPPGMVSVGEVVQKEEHRLRNSVSSRAFNNNVQTLTAEKRVLSRRYNGKIQSKNAASPGERKGSWLPSFTLKRSNTPVLPETLGEPQGIMPASSANAHGGQELAHLDQIDDEHSNATCYLGSISPLKWLVTVLMAIIVALQAGGLILGAYHLGQWKLSTLHQTIKDTGSHFLGFCWLLAYALPACCLASLMVTYGEPNAGGSGIPEVKAYLNGISMPRAFLISTWFYRCAGLVLVTSSGLFAGPEGPFVQIGAIVGTWFSDGPSCIGLRCFWPHILMGHKTRCEFMSQGTAMGVAAAFGAPLGGVLFSLEEVVSYWKKSLAWRAFMGTLIASAVAKLTISNFTGLSTAGFIEFPDTDASFQLWEFAPMALLGIVSGLFGALFCRVVKFQALFRRSLFSLGSPTPGSQLGRLLEVALIVFWTVTVCYWVPLAVGCAPLPEQLPLSGQGSSSSSHGSSSPRLLAGGVGPSGPPDLSGLVCDDMEYSVMAYILLEPKEAATKALFSKDMARGAQMDIASLLLCFFIIYITTLLTFGSALSVGLFIPNILSGACLGRAWGEMLRLQGLDVHVGVYALLGAAGSLSGFSRMTLALAVIFMEITTIIDLLTPLMLVILLSKLVADRFGPGVVDLILELNPAIHLIEDDLADDSIIAMQSLTVHDACTPDVVVLRKFEPVGKIASLLLETTFGGYPVVSDDHRLIGFVHRPRLVCMLSRCDELNHFVHMLELVDTFPECTNWSTPLASAFHRFQSSGLQHLCVINEYNRLVGILTRTDFAQLCQNGSHGVEAVKSLIHRKADAVCNGLVPGDCYQDEAASETSSEGSTSNSREPLSPKSSTTRRRKGGDPTESSDNV